MRLTRSISHAWCRRHAHEHSTFPAAVINRCLKWMKSMTEKPSSQKTPLQAAGGGPNAGKPDGVASPTTHGRAGKSESAGGAYPNPHSGKKSGNDPGSFMGHGGQTEIAYHGTGQLGETDIADQKNDNAPTKSS
jgi:hypothetical protein